MINCQNFSFKKFMVHVLQALCGKLKKSSISASGLFMTFNGPTKLSFYVNLQNLFNKML